MAVFPHLYRRTSASPTAPPNHFLFLALSLSFFLPLAPDLCKVEQCVAKLTQTTVKVDGQGEGQQTHYPPLISSVLTQLVPLLYYKTGIGLPFSSLTHIMTLSLISCHPTTNSTSGWRARPGLKLGLLCIKTQLYGIYLVLMIGVGVRRSGDRWE